MYNDTIFFNNIFFSFTGVNYNGKEINLIVIFEELIKICRQTDWLEIKSCLILHFA